MTTTYQIPRKRVFSILLTEEVAFTLQAGDKVGSLSQLMQATKALEFINSHIVAKACSFFLIQGNCSPSK
jgi:hypothetical protein